LTKQRPSGGRYASLFSQAIAVSELLFVTQGTQMKIF
jgi:hypothetical protein